MDDTAEKVLDTIVFDIGSTFTKATAFAEKEGKLIWAGRAQAPTTVEDIGQGLQAALKALAETLHCQAVTAKSLLSTSSAAGGLRMVAMGYMPRVTAKAAKEVAMNAGARVLEVMSFEDPAENKFEMLQEINPDIILLAGGTDGGDIDSMLSDARIIVKSKVKATVVIAGNTSAQPMVKAILQDAGIKTVRVPNVMPTIHELRVIPAREAIHEQFIRQITEAKGLGNLVDRLTEKKVVPTPGAVLMAAELLAQGSHEEDGIGNLIVIDLGGATTDIHSVIPELEELSIEERGLVITNEKQVSYRTVEGNLGLRVSASGIVEASGAKTILARVGLSGDEEEQALTAYAASLEEQHEYLAVTDREKLFDKALAETAVEIALKRHAGYISQQFDPVMGIVPGTPVGRDLRRVKTIIAVGGIFASLPEEEVRDIIVQALAEPGISLLPAANVDIVIDRQYLLYAIGRLADRRAAAALAFAKTHFGFMNCD